MYYVSTEVYYIVSEAAENGKIVVDGDPSEKGGYYTYIEDETFCESYSISGDTLTLTGGVWEGTYTKRLVTNSN